MRKVIGAAFVSLDGVIQAPGGPDEDKSGGFKLGGWLAGFFDEEVGQQIGTLFDGEFDLLLGRRTYEIFAAYWPFMEGGDDGKIADAFNRAAKYVLTGGDQPLTWANSHRLKNLDDLAALKRTDGPDLVIQGSGTIYPQLLKAGLLDQLTTMTFPVVLGPGKRLFGEGTEDRALKMTQHRVTGAGTVIATYQPQGRVTPGSFQAIEPTDLELARQKRVADGTW